MRLSVVVPTLNGRSELPATLSAIADHAPDAEVIVVNGPSADGTSGYLCGHETVDTFLELSDRNLNVARNAGIRAASGDAVAFLGQDTQIEAGWLRAVRAALGAGADAVTGPIHRQLGADVTTESLEETTLGDRTIRFFDGGNVVFDRAAIEALDGFDEYLRVDAARDLAHRLAAQDRSLTWKSGAAVLRTDPDPTAQADPIEADSKRRYRSRGYRLAKNYGLDWHSGLGLAGGLVRDGLRAGWAALRGEEKPSAWLGQGRDAMTAVIRGVQDGLAARYADRTLRRNPHGVSARYGRPVTRCEED
ncbi:glycosyltransferase, type 2 [Halodesulfurarchaeum formicicum]|uniref:Glycosyltransferase, type 2 n=1 Tax=Halodesulfurarchaeum formicicum TaxID=1873524 RepID=A0A1D8S5L2_9EURY|nr:glycosyltransferase family A protein [Halodesulfurarchaeum formicicum]AOW80625.1 glycosyltransferase, type 2 [Halodesulfurarchaeum formicicum]APE95964.1 glycosyltransferase, type 2 [Halodesulfurarchaeum formicicum]